MGSVQREALRVADDARAREGEQELLSQVELDAGIGEAGDRGREGIDRRVRIGDAVAASGLTDPAWSIGPARDCIVEPCKVSSVAVALKCFPSIFCLTGVSGTRRPLATLRLGQGIPQCDSVHIVSRGMLAHWPIIVHGNSLESLYHN